MSEFYCPYWNCPLNDVSDPQQTQCFALGKSCEICMEDAEDEEYAE